MVNLVLKDIGKNKVKVIKILCEVTGVSLKEAEDIVESVCNGKEYTITNIPEGNVEIIITKLEEVGAVAVVAEKIINSAIKEDDEEGNVMFCRQCGAKLNVQANFCGRCGAVVNDENHNSSDGSDQKRKSNKTPEHVSEYDEKPRDDQSILGGFSMLLKSNMEKLKNLWKDAKTKKDFQTMSILIGVLCAIGLCVLFLFVMIGFVLNSPFLLLGIIGLCYFFYQRSGASMLVYVLYESRSNKLYLPNGMNSQILKETLEGKFDYPYLENIQCGENGECVIKGKYAECQVIFNSDGITYLSCTGFKQEGLRFYSSAEQRFRESYLEAMAIRSYINKFFNPTMSINAAKDFNRLKFMEKQKIFLSPALSYCAAIICLIICVKIFFPSLFQYITSPGWEVRGAYLSQYSEETTIEEAFDNFFDGGKWRKYKADDGYKYVAFTGTCSYLDQIVDVRITFKITGDNFRVDRVEINGEEQNELIELGLFLAIYNDY